ncbi:DsbA family protein [Catenulispora subtropica]|uniref:Thioredoxin domain-containing protein n=1 Tax=Catenulispora subtropica TaxID=450798 RepID=A0ABN2TCD4_9ACTN
MSQANRVGKQNARERVAAEKLKRQRAERRRKQITIGTSVVAVLAIAGGIGIAVQASKHNSNPYLAPTAAVVDPQAKSGKDLGIHVGSVDAPVTMNVFEDFRCPVCQQVETTLEPTYRQYIEDGKLQVIYHPARVIDSHDNGKGSLNGANAAACAQDQGQFMALHDLLYANQPNEQQDVFADKAKILAIADQIPYLKASTAFAACVNSGQHDGWVQANADNFNKIGLQGTPTVFLEGQQLTFSQNSADAVLQYFKQQLDDAFTKKGGKAGTKTTLPTAPTSSAPSASGSSGAPSSGAPSSGAPSSGAPSSGATSSAPSSSGSSPAGTPTSSKS